MKEGAKAPFFSAKKNSEKDEKSVDLCQQV